MNEQMIFWLMLAVVLFVVEASTANLVSVWFGIGALFAIIPASLNSIIAIQVAVFVLVSLAALALIFPLVNKKKQKQPTNADRIIGQEGIITEEVNGISGKGQVKVMGSIWSAKSADDFNIEEGTKVKIVGIEGVKAVVSKEEEK